MNIILVILNHTVFLDNKKENLLFSKFFLKKVELFNKIILNKEINLIDTYNFKKVDSRKNLYSIKKIGLRELLKNLINDELLLFTSFLNYYKNYNLNLDDYYLNILKQDFIENLLKYNKEIDVDKILETIHSTKLTYKE